MTPGNSLEFLFGKSVIFAVNKPHQRAVVQAGGGEHPSAVCMPGAIFARRIGDDDRRSARSGSHVLDIGTCVPNDRRIAPEYDPACSRLVRQEGKGGIVDVIGLLSHDRNDLWITYRETGNGAVHRGNYAGNEKQGN